MKDLTYDEIQKAPEIVQYICTMSMIGFPIGLDTYNKAIEKHPEYFPDEVEHRRKWNSIPQSVHDAHSRDYKKMCESLPETKNSGGLMHYIEMSDEERREVDRSLKTWSDAHKKGEKELYKKHYAKYLD